MNFLVELFSLPRRLFNLEQRVSELELQIGWMEYRNLELEYSLQQFKEKQNESTNQFPKYDIICW
jgi:hypothetical protein